MVKGFDPTQTDVASFLLNYLFELRNRDPTLTLVQSQQLVKHWLQNSPSTSKIYQQFSHLNLRPRIKLKQRCRVRKGQIKDQPDQYFPTSSQDQEILICLDKVRNKLELKEHLDREVSFCYLQHANADSRGGTAEERERQLVRNIYESCYSGYRNYMLEDKATRELSLICSKYLFFRKTHNNLPVDRLFRYATQLTEEVLL